MNESIEYYERQACKALWLHHPAWGTDGRDIYHDLGTFRIQDSEVALEQVADKMERYEDVSFFKYGHFKRYVSRIEAVRTEINSLDIDHTWSKLDKMKLELLSRYEHAIYTPDGNSYASYLAVILPDDLSNLILYHEIPALLPIDDNNPHSYVLGTTRSGKTELLKLAIHTIVKNPRHGSAVVLDPNGDFAQEIAQWRDFVGTDRLIYIKPNLARGMTPVLNPFEIHDVEADDYSEEALGIKEIVADQLVEGLQMLIAGGGAGSSITLPMHAILSPCVLALLNRPGSTLRDLRRFMNDDDNHDLVAFGRQLPGYEDTRNFFVEGGIAQANVLTKQAIKTKLGVILGNRAFSNLTCGKSTFDLERLINRKHIIVFHLSKGAMPADASRAFGRLVIAMMLGIAIRRESIHRSKRVPCYLTIDECHNFLSKTMAEVLSEGGKYKLHLTLAQQAAGYEMSDNLKKIVYTCATQQFAGGSSEDSAADCARLFGLPASEVVKLATGQFITRARRQSRASS